VQKAKPEFEQAADELADNRRVAIAAVDATLDPTLSKRFDVSGFPTFKHFTFGKLTYTYEGGRTAADFVDFVNNPRDGVTMPPPPPPPNEGPLWSEQENDVAHLTDATFESVRSESAASGMFAMFYAPWCGHCKAMKPAYEAAASQLLGKVPFSAVDCTRSNAVCKKFDVQGYPTIKYIKGTKVLDYDSGRDQDALVAYARKQAGLKEEL
jgi:thioredoxin domain-containing protein 5